MLTSRFLFHLQAAQRRASNPQGTTTMSFQDHDGAGTLLFERVIGSLGASIDTGTEDGYTDFYDEEGGNLPTVIQVTEDLTAAGENAAPEREMSAGLQMTPRSP